MENRIRTGYDVADYVGARPDALTEARKVREAQEAATMKRALDLYASGSAGVETLRAFVRGAPPVSTAQPGRIERPNPRGTNERPH